MQFELLEAVHARLDELLAKIYAQGKAEHPDLTVQAAIKNAREEVVSHLEWEAEEGRVRQKEVDPKRHL